VFGRVWKAQKREGSSCGCGCCLDAVTHGRPTRLPTVIQRPPDAIMNGAAREAQEDTRVTVDSLQDWQRIKAGYSQAAVKQLDEELAARGLAHERDAHLAHLNDVSPFLISMLL
jgi:hypothetical protein